MTTYQNKGDYLLVEFAKPYSLNVALAIVHDIADRCQKDSLYTVLIDFTKMEGNPSILDRYHLGVEIARVWGPRIRSALVVKHNIINYMMENVAINRGAKVKSFSELNSALKWLGVTETPRNEQRSD
jgi:hypothetical protein